MLDGILLKMLVLSYLTDADGNKLFPLPFPVMYNPESFSKNLTVEYQCKGGPGDDRTELSFYKTSTGDVSFEFLFDATGASNNGIQSEVAGALQGVDVQIALFKQLTAERNPISHQPPKLTLVWGTFIFDCRLVSMTTNYTLFSSIGRPLRAKVNATFKGDEPRSIISAIAKLFSADLTHVHLVKAGETLPMIAKRIYGNPAYYMEIAKVNQLKNFRSIKPGTELILPPVNKLEVQ